MLAGEIPLGLEHIKATYRPQNEASKTPWSSSARLFLPGVLALDAAEHTRPLWPVFDNKDMFYLSYTSSESSEVAKDVADFVTDQTGNYDSMTLVCDSLGGTYLPKIIEHLNGWFDLSKLRALVIDSPSDISDVFGLSNRLGAQLLAPWLPAAKSTCKMFKHLMQPPESENIADWSPEEDYIYLSRTPENQKDYEELVIEWAMRRLHVAVETPELLKRYLNQLAWIARGTKNAPWELLRDIPITYIACTNAANTTIRQPRAFERWHKLTNCEIRLMQIGAHSAFVEQPTLWRNLIDSTLRDLEKAALCKIRAAPLWSRLFYCLYVDLVIRILYSAIDPTREGNTNGLCTHPKRWKTSKEHDSQ